MNKNDSPCLPGHKLYLSDLERNLDSFVTFDRLGQSAPYKKTYAFDGEYINDNHKYYAECPTGLRGIETNIDIGIDGYLQAADALKLYELAYFCNGDVLELGTHKGLSTSILCQALFDSSSPGVLETDDDYEETTRIAQKTLNSRPGVEKIRFHLMDANICMDQLITQSRAFS
ncbi:MAG: hypothetical protein GY869_29605, partial [Planctomycetes bacterium]|nr:hypothetical protein [Planctomycetota bacterium]